MRKLVLLLALGSFSFAGETRAQVSQHLYQMAQEELKTCGQRFLNSLYYMKASCLLGDRYACEELRGLMKELRKELKDIEDKGFHNAG